MSPTEDDLRSALSRGAGDAPDVDHIMFAARERRVQRRQRALSVAGAVVLVGALGTGGVYLVRHGSTSTASGGKAAAPAAEAAPSKAASGTSSTSGTSGTSGGRTGTKAAPAVTCPSFVPHTLLPGGGGTTQFGATGTLFARPVAAVTVCAYPSTGGAADSVQLSGSDAKTFAASLENAPTSRPGRMCSDLRRADQKSLAIIATSTDGTRLKTVTTTINEPACAVQVSNGTAVRYDWSWPSSLASQLAALSDATAGGNSGPVASPVH